MEEARRQDFRCDVLVIGGGATGLGTAVDAACRGYKTILLEQHDFAKATSSRSTKLVHGGVRYLAQGDVQMVIGALHERGRMRQNAPHLVKDMRFIIGNYRWWEQAFYTIGLTCYDVLAGRFQVCTPDQVLEECRLLIEHLDVNPLHFTSNHASNYLPLKGGLPEDREKFLALIDQALEGKIRLRKTLNRGI